MTLNRLQPKNVLVSALKDTENIDPGPGFSDVDFQFARAVFKEKNMSVFVSNGIFLVGLEID
jgi:hypothetical protein